MGLGQYSVQSKKCSVKEKDKTGLRTRDLGLREKGIIKGAKTDR
jgi:hypothetical protein